MEDEANITQRLLETKTELDKYKAVYGDHSTLPAGVSELAEQLKQKEEDIERLRLVDAQRIAVRWMFPNETVGEVNSHVSKAQTQLDAEVDTLSVRWEALDRQLKSKVFELSAMEDRINKIGLDVCFVILHLRKLLIGFYSGQNPKISSMLRCEIRKPLR